MDKYNMVDRGDIYPRNVTMDEMTLSIFSFGMQMILSKRHFKFSHKANNYGEEKIITLALVFNSERMMQVPVIYWCRYNRPFSSSN